MPLRPESTKANWRTAARVLKDANPSMTNVEIARLVGVSTPAVWKLFNPERAREMSRRDNARRHQAKLAWQNAKDHSEEGRVRCAVCGGLKGMGSARKSRSDRCLECIQSLAQTKQSIAEGMWADGWKLSEMAEVFGGVTPEYFQARRVSGWNLPHRRTPEQVARMREARWGLAA